MNSPRGVILKQSEKFAVFSEVYSLRFLSRGLESQSAVVRGSRFRFEVLGPGFEVLGLKCIVMDVIIYSFLKCVYLEFGK